MKIKGWTGQACPKCDNIITEGIDIEIHPEKNGYCGFCGAEL